MNDTWAIRCKLDGEEVGFLVIGQTLNGGTREASLEEVVDVLEECKWETWPPRQGKPGRFLMGF